MNATCLVSLASAPATPTAPWRGRKRWIALALVLLTLGWVASGRWGLRGPVPLAGWCAWGVWLVALAWHDAHTSRLPRLATVPAVLVTVGSWWALRASVDSLGMALGVLATAGVWAATAWWARRRHGAWTMGLGDALFMVPTALLFAAYDLVYVATWCAIAAGLWVIEGLRPRAGLPDLPCGPVLAASALLIVPWVWSTPAAEAIEASGVSCTVEVTESAASVQVGSAQGTRGVARIDTG